jgi:transcription initiation factor IIE alpha subunit
MSKRPFTKRILAFLEKKGVAVTTKKIAMACKIPMKKTRSALQQLRRTNKIGIACRIHNTHTNVYKTYWGVK